MRSWGGGVCRELPRVTVERGKQLRAAGQLEALEQLLWWWGWRNPAPEAWGLKDTGIGRQLGFQQQYVSVRGGCV